MTDEQLIAYHSARAMKELDCGLIAKCQAASRAHLALANLHMEQVRTLARVLPPLSM